ncbi:MAG TPA: ribosome recycling factor [Bacilli bacterium]|nr:ribosome recycling factor [Bacilli bacterium]
MGEDFLANARLKLDKSIASLEDKFTSVRAGRANPRMLDDIKVSYYGVPTELKQLATISVPEARQLNIKPFDRSILGAIEKAIFEANIGVTPNNNGEMIFISIPPLNEERRKDLVKQVKEYSEECRISIRNIRRGIIDDIKKDIESEDTEKSIIDRLQLIVDDYNKKVDSLAKEKEQELMSI